MTLALWLACLAVSGERVTVRDLAAADARWSAAPPDETLGFSPAPGVRRTFTVPELRRAAARLGIAEPPETEMCVERPLRRITPEEAAAAIRALFRDPTVRVEVEEVVTRQAPLGEVRFAMPTQPSQPATFHGYVAYDGSRKFPVWARARVTAERRRLVATQDLSPADPIAPGQFRVETIDAFPALAEPVADIAGWRPRRRIAAGEEIHLQFLVRPPDIRKGDRVMVDVEAGRARLQLEATAETAGSRGQPVRLRNPVSGRVFAARAAGPRKAIVP